MQTNEIAVGVQAILLGDRAQGQVSGGAEAADGDAFAFEIAYGSHVSLDGEKVVGTAEQDGNRFNRQAGGGCLYR